MVENEANGDGLQKKEKRKLSISIELSKEEIEEDVFNLTGSKPTRRPKKRAKNIQKHLDSLFPGLWLTSITPDSYKIFGMHGFNRMQCQKKKLVEVVSRIQLMNLGRSTLHDDSVSLCGCLDLKVVMKDLKAIDWNECHITSIHTQNAVNSKCLRGRPQWPCSFLIGYIFVSLSL